MQELFSTIKKPIKAKSNGLANKLHHTDIPFHNWYRFVLSFPPHLVREYINKFGLNNDSTILDPFCGTGTTIVESKLHGINSIGIEANPMTHFASTVKVDWSLDPSELLKHASLVASEAKKESNYCKTNLRALSPDAHNLLIKNSVSPLPLHKGLILLDKIRLLKNDRLYNHELLAFAKTMVLYASNLHFGPEVGVCRNKKEDAPVVESWISEIKRMVDDLCFRKPEKDSYAIIHRADSRQLQNILEPNSIDAIFTSPPYPNEKDYSRTTRLESVLLGFINDKDELRALKKNLLRSNTRNVYKGDDDDKWISNHGEIQRIATKIERRRIKLGKTSGFEKLYSKVTRLYFGGMARHLATLRPFLKANAYLGYVVGDQASYLRVMIRTGSLFADIAESLGFKVESIDLFRTRFSTTTKKEMREEVVVLRWPGHKG
ncbi:MAG: DNA methyltransferase [Sedimentisphaerales bacterium]